MDSSFYIILAGLVTLGGFVFVIIAKQKGMLGETNYQTIFILGVILLPIGFGTDNQVLLILGLVYILLGLVNKDKWGNRHKETVDRAQIY